MGPILFFFSSLFLAEIETADLFLPNEEGNYLDQFMNMIFTLAIVLGLILVTLWVFKKFLASRNRHLNRSTNIQILERRALSQKSSLYLIQVEDKKMLISDSPAGISLISHCTTEEIPSLVEEEETITRPSFSALISNKLKGLFVKNG